MKAQKNLRVASSASTFVPTAAWKTPSSCCSTQPFLKIQIWQSLSRENIQTLFLNFQEECFFFFFSSCWRTTFYLWITQSIQEERERGLDFLGKNKALAQKGTRSQTAYEEEKIVYSIYYKTTQAIPENFQAPTLDKTLIEPQTISLRFLTYQCLNSNSTKKICSINYLCIYIEHTKNKVFIFQQIDYTVHIGKVENIPTIQNYQNKGVED